MYAKFGKALALAAVLLVSASSYAAEAPKTDSKSWTQTIKDAAVSAKDSAVLYVWNAGCDEATQKAWAADTKSWKPWILNTYKAGVVVGSAAALYYAYVKYTEPAKTAKRSVTYTTGYTA